MALPPPGSLEAGTRLTVRAAISSAEEAARGARLAAVELKGRTRFRGQQKIRSHLLWLAREMELQARRLGRELRALGGV